MKVWVIKKGKKYVANQNYSKEYTKNINKAMLYFTKKHAKGDCHLDNDETIVTVDVQIEEIDDGDNQ